MIFLIYLVAANVFAFVLFGLDKRRARKGLFRIKESSLLAAAIMGGSPGALMGMHYFRHKTRHPLFKFGIPAILTLHMVLLLAILRFINRR